MVDAPVLGTGLTRVGVRLPSQAPSKNYMGLACEGSGPEPMDGHTQRG